jgi:hypothetical protein
VFSLRDFVQHRFNALNRNRGAGIHQRVEQLLTHFQAGLEEIIASMPEEAYMAALLDPRMLDVFIPANMRAAKWATLEERVEAMWASDFPAPEADPAAPAPGPAPAAALSAVPDPALRAGTRGRPAPPVAKKTYDEIVQEKLAEKGRAAADARPYRERQPIGSHASVADWWREHEKIYPRYANAARRYLAIPATSAPCERLFSTGGRVLEKRRASLNPSSVRDIVIVHDNIYLLDELEFDEEAYDYYD